MPKIVYLHKAFRVQTRAIIRKANDIIDEYACQGFCLTVRQLYYQFVARDQFPDSWIDTRYNAKFGLPSSTKNTLKNYKRLVEIISDARLAGLIDWDAIEDRTRNLVSLSHWDDPADIVNSCASQFHVDLWDGQECHCEVWIEKEALTGIIDRVCEDLDVSYFACRGYVSQSEMWNAARRFSRLEGIGKETVILHLGDHDPSGIDMTRDIQDRLNLFESRVKVRRIALNMDQVTKYNPPPNPAKVTDTRFDSYVAKFGEDSWELDALEPKVISNLIKFEVCSMINQDPRNEQLEKRSKGRDELGLVAENWRGIIDRLEDPAKE